MSNGNNNSSSNGSSHHGYDGSGHIHHQHHQESTSRGHQSDENDDDDDDETMMMNGTGVPQERVQEQEGEQVGRVVEEDEAPCTTTANGGSSGSGTLVPYMYHSCLCILLDEQLLQIYTPDGKSFRVPLPCRMRRMWTLNGKLLILERNIHYGNNNSNNNNSPSPTTGATQRGTDFSSNPQSNNNNHYGYGQQQQHPILFSLIHPLEELKPVAVLTDALMRDSPTCSQS